jgi:hypothetical protein
MIFDAGGGYLLAFGGTSPTGSCSNMTFEFSHGSWKRVHTHGPLQPQFIRCSGAYELAYDSKDGYPILTGGNGSGGTWAGTWKFVNSNWVYLNSSKSPAVNRTFTMVTYDAADRCVVLFGGNSATQGSFLNDTWGFKGGVWSKILTALSPPGRYGGSFAFDSNIGKVVLFGGVIAGGGELNDTWTYSGGVWTNVTTPSSPSPRLLAGLGYDPSDHSLLLFGGSIGARDRNDTWAYSGGSWTKLSPINSPSSRERACIAFDAATHKLILFGGAYSSPTTGALSFLNDSWKFGHGDWVLI